MCGELALSCCREGGASLCGGSSCVPSPAAGVGHSRHQLRVPRGRQLHASTPVSRPDGTEHLPKFTLPDPSGDEQGLGLRSCPTQALNGQPVMPGAARSSGGPQSLHSLPHPPGASLPPEGTEVIPSFSKPFLHYPLLSQLLNSRSGAGLPLLHGPPVLPTETPTRTGHWSAHQARPLMGGGQLSVHVQSLEKGGATP